MKPIIKARGLSKRYEIGERESYQTFRSALTNLVRRPLKGRQKEPAPDATHWALSDVSFDIMPGEVAGIVGRNGAGKSTLLKVLSRITTPTSGTVELYGRVGSLLEVGTGFHPELTGRENIFLNGAILGMGRAEILKKLDGIVAFAETQRSLDTPVKRYSSGMYVRLAFAVAAHLEPEILIVDEVLAVGDSRFQRKCLGKMQDVAHHGRTVLFVSHNMAILQTLCTKGYLLEGGALVHSGPIGEVIAQYHRRTEEYAGSISLADRTDRRGDGSIRFTAARLTTGDHGGEGYAQSGEDLTITLDYERRPGAERLGVVRLAFTNAHGQRLFMCLSRTAHEDVLEFSDRGELRCVIPRLPLLPGRYNVSLWCKLGEKLADEVQDGLILEVLPGDFFGTGKLNPDDGGSMLVEHRWEHESLVPA